MTSVVPLSVSPRRPLRVLYREGQPLTAADLRDQQSYLRDQELLHRITQHRWGVVRGLGLTAVDRSRALEIRHGIAVDELGRELVLRTSPVLAASELAAAGRQMGCPAGPFDLWIRYSSELVRTAADEGPADRVREFAELTVTCATPEPVDPDRSWDAGIPPGSEGPSRPVYLGRVRLATSMDASSEGAPAGASHVVVLPARVRDATQVGGTWFSTDGRSQVRLMGSSRPRDTEVTVRLEDRTEVWRTPLRIPRLGAVEIDGALTVDGDLRLAPGQDPPSAMRWAATVQTPEGPRPWRAYRTRIASQDEEEGEEAEEAEEEERQPEAEEVEELRFEIEPAPAEGELPLGRGFVVGASKPPPTTGREPPDEAEIGPGESGDPVRDFRPILQVAPNGIVRIAGDLIVDGALNEPPLALDPKDPRFLPAMDNAWYGGLEAGLVRAAPTLDLRLGIEVTEGSPTVGFFVLNDSAERLTLKIKAGWGSDPSKARLVRNQELDVGQVAAVFRNVLPRPTTVLLRVVGVTEQQLTVEKSMQREIPAWEEGG